MGKRRWTFALEGREHTVEFQHGYFLGNRTYIVDGVRTTEHGRPFMDHSGQYPIRIDGHAAAVWIATNGLTYSYDLVIDGRSMSSGLPATHPPRPPAGSPRLIQLSGVAALVIAIPIAIFAFRVASDEYRLRSAGAPAVGIVQSKSVTSGRYSPSYRVSYLFTDARGALWRGQGAVSKAAYDAARPGSTFRVVYVTADPSINRFAAEDNTFAAVGFPVMAAGTVASGAYLLWKGRRLAEIARRIGAAGQPINATVTKLRSAYVRGIGRVVTVEYEYDDPFGQRRRGRGPVMYPLEAERYSVGGLVRILIDPDRPKDSVLP